MGWLWTLRTSTYIRLGMLITSTAPSRAVRPVQLVAHVAITKATLQNTRG